MSKFKVGDKVRIKGGYFLLNYPTSIEHTVSGVRTYVKGPINGDGQYYHLDNRETPIPEHCLCLAEDVIDDTQSSDNNGGKTDYYQLPEWVKVAAVS